MLRARGEGHKKIWATEYGAPSMPGTSRQTELVVNGMMQWAESGFAGPMYIHHHRDQDANDGYGLADQNLQPKEAAYGVQALAAQQFPQRWEAIVFASNADPRARAKYEPGVQAGRRLCAGARRGGPLRNSSRMDQLTERSRHDITKGEPAAAEHIRQWQARCGANGRCPHLFERAGHLAGCRRDSDRMDRSRRFPDRRTERRRCEHSDAELRQRHHHLAAHWRNASSDHEALSTGTSGRKHGANGKRCLPRSVFELGARAPVNKT
jgi:hypothetical protein